MFGSYTFGSAFFARGDALQIKSEVGTGIPYELWPKYGLRLPKRASEREKRRPQTVVIHPVYGLIAGESFGESYSQMELIGIAAFSGKSAGSSKASFKAMGLGQLSASSEGDSDSLLEMHSIGQFASHPIDPITAEEIALALTILAD